jgi:hypothetical protein
MPRMEILADLLSSIMMFTPEMIGTAFDREQPTAMRWLAGIGGGLGITTLAAGFVAIGYAFAHIGG